MVLHTKTLWLAIVAAPVVGFGTYAETGDVCTGVVYAVGIGLVAAALIPIEPLSFYRLSWTELYLRITLVISTGVLVFISILKVAEDVC